MRVIVGKVRGGVSTLNDWDQPHLAVPQCVDGAASAERSFSTFDWGLDLTDPRTSQLQDPDGATILRLCSLSLRFQPTTALFFVLWLVSLRPGCFCAHSSSDFLFFLCVLIPMVLVVPVDQTTLFLLACITKVGFCVRKTSPKQAPLESRMFSTTDGGSVNPQRSRGQQINGLTLHKPCSPPQSPIICSPNVLRSPRGNEMCHIN